MDHCVSSHQTGGGGRGGSLPITKTARTTKRDARREDRASRYLVSLLIVFSPLVFLGDRNSVFLYTHIRGFHGFHWPRVHN